jgi:hypothetical protein
MQAKGMKAIGLIEDRKVIKNVLKYLGIWLVKKKPSPKANAPPVHIHLDYSDSQVPPCEDYLFHDPEYPIEAYAS